MPATATGARTSDKECFSELSDVHTPKLRIPPCAKCGKPSLGGCFVAADPVHPAGAPIVTVEFYCAEDRTGDFLLMSDRLFPVWKILTIYSESKMRVQRLLRDRQIQRVVGE